MLIVIVGPKIHLLVFVFDCYFELHHDLALGMLLLLTQKHFLASNWDVGGTHDDVVVGQGDRDVVQC